MGTLLSYLVIYIIYIYIIIILEKQKKNKTEHMLRIEYNVYKITRKEMAARLKKLFQCDNILLLGLEGSDVF